MHKGGATYILSSPNRATLYTGVTSDLAGRIYDHKSKTYPDSFSKRYNCVILVYYRYFDSIEEAIEEEKLKGGSRRSKEKLVDSMNPDWRDLYDEIF